MAVLEFEFVSIGANGIDNDINKINNNFKGLHGTIEQNIQDNLKLANQLKEVRQQLKETGNSNVALSQSQRELQQRYNDSNAIIRQQINAFDKTDGSLSQMRSSLSLANRAFDNLNKTAREGSIGQNLSKQIATLTQEISKAEQATGRYQRNVGNYQQAQSGANGVAMEFNRIIQDAPFGMMGMGNNIQQLAANWQSYTTQVKAAATANGTTVTTMGLVKGAMVSILSPANLLTLGIAAITSAWTYYTMQQQKANSTTKEAKNAVDELIQSVKNQTSVIGQASAQAQANYASEENKLKSLWKITQDATSSVKARGNALNELKNLYPSIFEKYDLETIKTKNATNAYLDLTKAIQLSAKARSFEVKLAEQFGKQFDLQQFIKENKDKFSNMNKLIAEQRQYAGKSGLDLIADWVGFSKLIGNEQPLEDYNKGLSEFQKTLTELGKTDDEIKALTGELDKLYQTQANGLGFGDFKKGVDKTNNSLNKTTDKLKQAIDYLKELQSLSGVSEKDISLVGKVGLDFDVASIKYDYEERIKQIQTLQEQILADTTLTEAKRKELIEETNTYIAYLTGNVLANIKDLSNKATEYLDKMTVKAVKTYKDVEIAESPKQKQGRNREDDRNWREYANILNQSVNSIFTNLETNVKEFGLGFNSVLFSASDTLKSMFDSLNSKNNSDFITKLTEVNKNTGLIDIKENWKSIKNDTVEMSKAIGSAMGMVGNLVSNLSKSTSGVGQGIGGALSGAGAGLSMGTMLKDTLGKNGGLIGAGIGAVVGLIGGIFGAKKARKQEELQRKQLEEQKKANALLERMSALSYASQIIGQKTEYGIISGVRRNEFGQIVSVVQGQDIIMVADRTNKQKGR